MLHNKSIKKSKLLYNIKSVSEEIGDNLVFGLISVVAISNVVLALSGCLADIFGLRSSDKVVLPILTFPVHDLYRAKTVITIREYKIYQSIYF